MPGPVRTAALQLRAAGRLVGKRRAPLRERLSSLDDRLVFVVGSPRSGTTFLAGAIGSLPGFIDLGEVPPFKAAIPELAALAPAEAARRLRRILDLTRRLGLVGRLRAVEQTPETAFLIEAVALAYPQGRIVHIVRDGRDVVCSLLERGWLSVGRRGEDETGVSYGPGARFWVEAERVEEFSRASDVRRAAWAWRSYVAAARASTSPVMHELRYERLSADPDGAADDLAAFLGVPSAALTGALRAAHGSSVGRYRTELTPAQLVEVEEEAGDLLRELGYL